MAFYKKTESLGFTVSNTFVSKYMPKANATYVKVYLYGMMMCQTGETEVSNKSIAKALDILESDIINAWKYWNSVGVVNYSQEDDYVEFNEIYERTAPKKHSYSAQEMANIIKSNKEIKEMFIHAEEIMGKTLNQNEISMIFNFCDNYKMDVLVVLLLLEYCVEQGKKNARFIQKTAEEWYKQGILTVEKAHNHINDVGVKYEYKNILGVSELPDKDIKVVKEWIGNYTKEQISEAKNIALEQIGKPSVNYINSVLKNKKPKKSKTIPLETYDYDLLEQISDSTRISIG